MVYGMSQEYASIREVIVSKMNELFKLLDDYVRKNHTAQPLVKKLREEFDEYKKIKEIDIIPPQQLEAAVHLVEKINELVSILKRAKELSSEEIKALIMELSKRFENYIYVTKSVRNRMKIAFYTPVYLAFAIYFLNIFIYAKPADLVIWLAIFAIGGIAVALSFYRLLYSYTMLMASALIGFLQLALKEEITSSTLFLFIIYVLVFLSSTSYLQFIRTTHSTEYRNRVKKLLSIVFEEHTKRDKKELEAKIMNEYEKLKKLYREIYGENGEALLNYKLNTLVMHGMPRNDAIKKLLKEIEHLLKSSS